MAMAVCAVMSGSLLFGAAETGWMAGVARADVTPRESMWLAGYAMRDHESQGTVHPLWAKALALRDAEGKDAVMVTCDVLGFPKQMSDRIRTRLKERLGLEPAQILLNASHSHSSPVLIGALLSMYPLDQAGLDKVERYSAWLEDQVVEVVEAAFAALQPAQLSAANGVVRFGVNRRNNKEAEILDAYDFNGPVDHAVPVLRVTDADGTPIALLFGYACHCTVLCDYQWCGDYAGFAQIALEQAYPGGTAMFLAGCGADINPLPRRSVALAEQYGTELAAAVTRVLKDAQAPLEPVLRTEYAETELALEAPPSRDELVSVTQTAPEFMRRAAREMIAELDAGRSLRTVYPYPVQVWRVGAQTIVALGGEVVVDYAIAIKYALGRDTFVLGFSNDLMSYIPSVRVLGEGGYEGATSQLEYGMPAKWQATIEQRVLDTVFDLARRAGAPVSPAP